MDIIGVPVWSVLGIVVFGYLFGSIPLAYLVVKLRLGTDIRDMGSGNVGSSNAIQALGKVPGLTVMAFDVFVKGSLPVIVVGQTLGYGNGAEVIAGTALLVGHNWSIFLRFTGGRGLGTGSGAMLAMAWPIWVVFAGIGLLNWTITRNAPVGWVIAFLVQPIIIVVTGLPSEYILYAALFAAVSGIKRVASNSSDRAVFATDEGMSKRHLYWMRLIYDRDIKDREAWLRGGRGR